MSDWPEPKAMFFMDPKHLRIKKHVKFARTPIKDGECFITGQNLTPEEERAFRQAAEQTEGCEMVSLIHTKAVTQVHAVTQYGGHREVQRLKALAKKLKLPLEVKEGRYAGVHVSVGEESVWLNVHHSRVENTNL